MLHLHLPVHISAGLVVIETLMTQKISVTTGAGQRASISCGGIDRCYYYVFWYQKKDTGTFERLLYFDTSDGEVSRYSHPQADDFSAEVQQNTCNLILQSADVSHTASYYCFCYVPGSSTVREDLSCLDKNQLLQMQVVCGSASLLMKI